MTTTTELPDEVAVEVVSMRRIVAVSVLAVFGPVAIGVLIALSRSDNSWNIRGGNEVLILVAALMGGFAAICARLGLVFPTAFGAMSGIGVAVGTMVRDGSSAGFSLAMLFAVLGGAFAGAGMPARAAPPRAPAVMLVIALVGATSLGIVGRTTPTGAALAAVADGSVVVDGVKIGRGADARRHVLVEEPSMFGPSRLAVVSLTGKGFGSWTSVDVRRLPADCGFEDLASLPLPEEEFGTAYPRGWSRGLFVSTLSARTICAVGRNGAWFGDALVAGTAPEGAALVEVQDRSGKIVMSHGLGTHRSFLLPGSSGDEQVMGDGAFRVAFRNRKGALLMSVPWPSDYGTSVGAMAVLSGEIGPKELYDHARRWTEPTIVTIGLMTRDESMELCGDLFTKSDWVKIGLVQVGETKPRYVRVIAPYHSSFDEAMLPSVKRATRTSVVTTPTAPCFN